MSRTLWGFSLAILVIAFALRLGAAVAWHQTAAAEGRLFRLGDSHSYWTLAEQISAGQPYQYGSENAKIFRAPLLPLMLAPITRIGDPPTAVLVARVMGCLLGTCAVGLIMLIATRLGGICAGLAAGGLAAVYPGALGMSVVVLSEAPSMPLIVLQLWLWQLAWAASTQRNLLILSLLAGCVAGLAVLARPSWLLFLPFAGGIGLLLTDKRWRHLCLCALSLLGLCLTMSPWWLRNAAITGHFVPTTLQVGPSLYDGLHAGATGASDEGMAFMQQFQQQQLEADRDSDVPLESTFEFRVNQRATQAAVAWARQHPVDVAKLAVAKFRRTWSLWPDGGDVGSFATRLALTVSCFGVLTLAILGSWLAIKPIRWEATICWLPCIYFTLLHMVFVGSIRYREPAVFVLTALAGCALARLAGCKLGSVQGSTSVSFKSKTAD